MVHPRRLRQGTIAGLVAVVLVSTTGCSETGQENRPAKAAVASVAPSASTHDAVLPIGSVNTWEAALRSGNGEVACAFLTSRAVTQVQRAARSEKVRARSCEQAAVGVFNATRPAPIKRFAVEAALADRTVLVVVRKDGSTQQVVLRAVDERWLIDAVGGLGVAR